MSTLIEILLLIKKDCVGILLVVKNQDMLHQSVDLFHGTMSLSKAKLIIYPILSRMLFKIILLHTFKATGCSSYLYTNWIKLSELICVDLFYIKFIHIIRLAKF